MQLPIRSCIYVLNMPCVLNINVISVFAVSFFDIEGEGISKVELIDFSVI